MKVMKDIPDLQFGEDFIWEYEDMLGRHAAVDLLQKLPCPDGVGHRPQCRGLLRLSCRLYLIFQSEYSDEAWGKPAAWLQRWRWASPWCRRSCCPSPPAHPLQLCSAGAPACTKWWRHDTLRSLDLLFLEQHKVTQDLVDIFKIEKQSPRLQSVFLQTCYHEFNPATRQHDTWCNASTDAIYRSVYICSKGSK